MAIDADGIRYLTLADVTVATTAADPTDAWLMHEDGSTSLDPADDLSRFTVPGYWPRYLMRAGSLDRFLGQYPDRDTGLAALNSIIRRNLGGDA